MNPAAVLMCWNIPYLSEDVLHELFCIAGPVEDVSFSKNGKSCFIVYEHEEAVATAKEIFQDVKLNNRPLRMFDREEVNKMYLIQEEQAAYSMNYDYRGSEPHNFRGRSYNVPRYTSRMGYNSHLDERNPPGNRFGDRYMEMSRHSSDVGAGLPLSEPQNNFAADNQRSVSMRNSSMTSNSCQNRSDLLPSSSVQSSKKHKFDVNDSVEDFLTSSKFPLETMMNPYNRPVSRNRQTRNNNYHSFQRNHLQTDEATSGSSNDLIRHRWEKNDSLPDEESHSLNYSTPSFGFDKSAKNPMKGSELYSENSVSRGDSKREGNWNKRVDHSRDYFSKMKHADFERPRPRNSKFHGLPPPEADYMSRNPNRREQDRRYQRQSYNRWRNN